MAVLAVVGAGFGTIINESVVLNWSQGLKRSQNVNIFYFFLSFLILGMWQSLFGLHVT
jgi:hypothetical protein